MPKQLADAVEQWADEQEVQLPEPPSEVAPYIKAYLCDGVHVDAEMPAAELERRMRRATRVIALYSDGTRKALDDGAK